MQVVSRDVIEGLSQTRVILSEPSGSYSGAVARSSTMSCAYQHLRHVTVVRRRLRHAEPIHLRGAEPSPSYLIQTLSKYEKHCCT